MSAGLTGAVVLWFPSECRALSSALTSANTATCSPGPGHCTLPDNPKSSDGLQHTLHAILLQVGDTNFAFALSQFVDLTYQWGNNSDSTSFLNYTGTDLNTYVQLLTSQFGMTTPQTLAGQNSTSGQPTLVNGSSTCMNPSAEGARTCLACVLQCATPSAGLQPMCGPQALLPFRPAAPGVLPCSSDWPAGAPPAAYPFPHRFTLASWPNRPWSVHLVSGQILLLQKCRFTVPQPA